MLSKLRRAGLRAGADAAGGRKRIKTDCVLDTIGLTCSRVVPVATGTSSATFIAKAPGRALFLKTHLDERGRRTLDRERAILTHLYPRQLAPERIETRDTQGRRTWLVMNVLEPASGRRKPEEILRLTRELEGRLQGFEHADRVPAQDSVQALMLEAQRALDVLARQDLLTREARSAVRAHLQRFERAIPNHRPVLCHGDLGPLNLMSHPEGTIAIDWEDCFWGVEGYDFLFWLTFFENRGFLVDGNLGRTPLGRPLELSTLVMIVLLKSVISLRTGTYCQNALSLEQRLAEFLALE